ncbi:MAG TPA: DEAD/DEAH box helicase, partial [Dehalococcoidia bacterium]|nr:DEAD/DEAH box helicase [Dehalococcoidia bacterium]
MTTLTPTSYLDRFQAEYPFPLDTFQIEAITALSAGRSVLVAAPTGTGKTVVAEFAVRQALERGQRAFYTTPIKALSNQKFRDFKATFGEDRVGLMTGDLVENPDAPVVVMTTEILRNRLVSDPEGLERSGAGLRDVDCVIFDEVHYLADPERGTAWEEAILLAPKSIQFVCLSATVSNADQIAQWLRATDRAVDLIFHAERAVPLEHFYFLDDEIHAILDTEGRRLKSFRGIGGELLPGNRFGGRSRRNRARPEPRPWEIVQALQRAKLLPGIYFVFSRRLVEESALDCVRLRLVNPAGAAKIRARLDERLAELSPEDRAIGQVQRLLDLLPRGIGFHHAGMIPILKILVEELFAEGLLKVCFATDTLSLGINMPAKSVVVGELTKFDGESRRLLLPNEYRQLTGRAGRRGIDKRGVAVVPYSPWVPF